MIDLSSDTATRPTAAMRQAMAEAEVGDEQRREDPTVNKLQEMSAALLGKDAALFLPSGTMCNAIAFCLNANRGEAVILDRESHPNQAEAGGPAWLANVMLRPVDSPRGVFGPDDVRRRFLPLGLVAAGEHDGRTGPGQTMRGDEAKTAVGAGYHGDPTVLVRDVVGGPAVRHEVTSLSRSADRAATPRIEAMGRKLRVRDR